MTIRNKIIISFTLITFFITVIFSCYIYLYNSIYRKEFFENNLLAKSELVAGLILTKNVSEAAIGEVIYKGDFVNLYEEKILFLFENGDIAYTNILEDTTLIFFIKKIKANAELSKNHYYESIGNQEFTISSYSNEKGERLYAMVMAHDIIGHDKISNLRSILLLGNAFVFFLALLFALFFTDAILSPIKKIIKKTNEISGANLDQRLDIGNGKDELAQIAINFNDLLARIEQVFISQKYFIAHASHELRTPLASVQTTLETSLNYDDSIPLLKSNIAKAITSLQKSISLTNGLLQLVNIENEKNMAMNPFRIDEVLLNVISITKNNYPNQEIKYKIVAIPEIENPFLCKGSNVLIETAFFNIIENACKYSSGLPIEVQLDFKNQDYIINIIDHGVGISENDFPHIYDTLYRGENVKSIKGHGLGLPLVKKIIELHHGKLTISSRLNTGTTVSVSMEMIRD